METLRVGIVGAGWMGHVHARAWAENAPRGRIVAIADAAEERARHLAGEVGDSEVVTYPSLQAMLDADGIDAVDICLPHHLHTEAIIAAARAGKAILCEKPLCTNLVDAAEIRKALEESGAIFVAAHNQQINHIIWFAVHHQIRDQFIQIIDIDAIYRHDDVPAHTDILFANTHTSRPAA